MNNETVKRFDITIKLRGDNVYDLYMNGKWVVSSGYYKNVLNAVERVIEESLINEV